jgi:hypothetical protein
VLTHRFTDQQSNLLACLCEHNFVELTYQPFNLLSSCNRTHAGRILRSQTGSGFRPAAAVLPPYGAAHDAPDETAATDNASQFVIAIIVVIIDVSVIVIVVIVVIFLCSTIKSVVAVVADDGSFSNAANKSSVGRAQRDACVHVQRA